MIQTPSSKCQSLRKDLLYLLMAAIVGSFMLASTAVYFMARYEVDEVMDYHLRQLALAQRDSIYSIPGENNKPKLLPQDQAFDMVIQIWDEQGFSLYDSNPLAVLPGQVQLGYATTRTKEGPWRTYSIIFGNRIVQVAQPMTLRTRVAANAALRTLLPLVMILPVVGFLIWFLIGRGLTPLDRLAKAVQTRKPEALDPLPKIAVPEEVQPLVEALNGLLSRLDIAMKTQRAFIADAAHELRTPLAALSIQLCLIERAHDEDTKSAGLLELKTGLQRTVRLAEQLLTLARSEPDGQTLQLNTIDITQNAAQIVTGLHALAHVKKIDLGMARWETPTWALADPEALGTLLTNLIDNALRHTPEGGQIDVNAYTATDEAGIKRAWLEVCDSGPGIPEQDRQRVLDRFYRRPGQSQPGSGLGLAIVNAIAQRHEATLMLEQNPHGSGLLVRIGFIASSPA